MEYVQTVLARIAANKFDEASGPGGLLAALEAHRDVASAQSGYRGMDITRSANPEGDVLVVAETHWANNNALADYSTRQPNVEGIFNEHADELVPGSLQTHRMQSDKAGQEAPTRAYDRLALALFVPLGVLAFALLVIYALSRIYLTLPGEWATPLAAGVALGVLGIAWYFASHPYVPRWQIAGLAVVVLGTLAIAGTAAAVYDEQNKEVKTVESPTAAPAPGTTPAAPGAPEIDMGDNFFQDASGQKNPTISISAGQETTINLNNKGQAIHNMHVANASGQYTQSICKVGGAEFCSDPAQVTAGKSAKLVVKFDQPGTYDYRCDFHFDQMKGKLEVK